ncbi:hypothetical protein BDZ94DRAFT_1322611 [Collybia nuda]|uniref:Uncharacterized protein n=1 Tax=Collybia nuda TaxID=64659 RepID=A0A9P6CE33_9AGAR|nr:hypothetical protein BDZ94DRAFT_1322611 [Collybia nuda]
MSTMMMETMTIGPSMYTVAASVSLVAPAPSGVPDIHDASRSKIVIKPRLKEYVRKQREIRRTLACFTSLDDSTPVESKTVPSSSSNHIPTYKNADETQPSQLHQSDRPNQSTKVHSGHIKKSKVANQTLARIAYASRPKIIPTAPHALRTILTPTQVTELVPVLSVDPIPVTIPSTSVIAPSLRRGQSCICPNPEACLYCRFLALADMFCAIVAAREQKLSMGK